MGVSMEEGLIGSRKTAQYSLLLLVLFLCLRNIQGEQ